MEGGSPVSTWAREDEPDDQDKQDVPGEGDPQRLWWLSQGRNAPPASGPGRVWAVEVVVVAVVGVVAGGSAVAGPPPPSPLLPLAIILPVWTWRILSAILVALHISSPRIHLLIGRIAPDGPCPIEVYALPRGTI